jgi:hypothetical protein
MKKFQLIALLSLITAIDLPSGYAQGTLAPLPLYINGGGTVSPYTNGELLEVGATYNIKARAAPGFAFSGWQPVNVFTFTTFTIDLQGNTNMVVSVVPSLLPTYTNQPSLDFVMQPVVVIFDSPGVRTITRSSGWQANFDPIILNIQVSGPSVILSWTNSLCGLQAAPSPDGAYTNLSGAVSPYTNNISAPPKYFRLISN